MTEWWILWAWRIIAVLGVGGVLFWMGQTIKAMKGTVDAQERTIRAQAEKMTSMETLLKAMETVLKSTDEQNMLARLKAHKDFVEHEKAAETKKLSDKFELEKKAMLAEATTTAEKIIDKYLQPLVSSVATFARNTLPYVPRSRRKEFIDGIKLPEDVQAPVKDFLYSVAANAPDLSAPTLADFAPSGTLSEAAKFADAVLTPPPLRTTPGDKYRV